MEPLIEFGSRFSLFSLCPSPALILSKEERKKERKKERKRKGKGKEKKGKERKGKKKKDLC